MNNLLQSCSGNFSSMLVMARKINQINDVLRENNPNLFTPTVCLSTIKDNIAVFVVDNSALSFRLKQQQNSIMDELKKLGVAVVDIQIKVKG